MCSGGGALLCNVNKKSPLLNSVKRKLYVFLTAIFLSLSCFGEVPHSYVTDNPNTQVNKIETIKEREKAELNLSVTKIKSKEIEGRLNQSSKNIEFILPSSLVGKQVVAVEKLEDLPNPSTVNGRKILTKIMNDRAISNNLTQEIKENNLIVNYKNQPEKLYISDLNGNFYKWKVNPYIAKNFDISPYYSEGLGMLYNKNYDELGNQGGDLTEVIFDSRDKYGKTTLVKKISGTNRVQVGHMQRRESTFYVRIYGYNTAGELIYTSSELGRLTSYSASPWNWAEIDWNVTLPEYCQIVIKLEGWLGNAYHNNDYGNNTLDVGQVFNVVLDDFIHKADGESSLVIDENYKPEYLKFDSCTIENLKPLSITNSVRGARITSTTGDGLLHLDPTDTLEINGQSHTLTSGNLSEQKLQLNKIDLAYKVENGKLQLKVASYGLKVPSPQQIDINIVKNKDIKDIMKHTINLTVPYLEKVLGESVLEVKEYYPTPQYILFNSCTLNAPADIALENSLKDVRLTQTTGKGLVALEQGHILEINGKEYTIGAGGNLAEQHDTLGNINFKFKVENGKLRLALTSWGVLEPDRLLTINAKKFDGTVTMEHKMTIKAPRRVEGSSDLTYDNDYQIRTFVRFGGISLTAPGISSLETPVPAGVALSSQAGQGIPFMEEGDILEVNDGVTRAVHQFTIGANGTLGKKQIKFNNSDVTLYVENGKLRAGLNNWIVNKPVKLNLRLIRGTNEIMNHAIGFKVPEAPFNIKENGLLDFGRVTAGSKRTAETNIILEMLNDVDSVKFNLKDTQPVMENANGKQLKVNEIQTIVKKQGERTYLVKLHGKLIIPEDAQMGEYSGSTILELRIK